MNSPEFILRKQSKTFMKRVQTFTRNANNEARHIIGRMTMTDYLLYKI